MSLFAPSDHAFAEVLWDLAVCNPFTGQRIECERKALGPAFTADQADWNLFPERYDDHPNIEALVTRAQQTLAAVRMRSNRTKPIGERDAALLENILLFVLYHRLRPSLQSLVDAPSNTPNAGRVFRELTELAKSQLPAGAMGNAHAATFLSQLPHVFACFFQLRRAFHNIFHYIIGVSPPAARLRASIWQSIFTHDMRRYRQILFDRMGDYTTLVTGPSGTGKELAARAIALSRYIPYVEKLGRLAADHRESFHAINLSALSPTLIESELFGHQRGAFTGAVAERQGYLEGCSEHGSVFLDEIGELDPSIQVKLLRVLQSRTFARLGDARPREFRGKILAATNRDLAAEMQAGRFRQDFYYRLCSDIIEMPSLRERFTADPRERLQLVTHIVERLVGPGTAVQHDIDDWISANLGPSYPWPGNIRELEQCVRNVLIRQSYRQPIAVSKDVDGYSSLANDMRTGTLSADDLLARYCRLVYAETGSYEATARRLMLDRRTVKAKIDGPVTKPTPINP